VLDYEKTPQEQRGTFLREKGLHDATLGRWKAEIIEGMKLKPFAQGKKDPQQKRNAALERELRRKESALVEAAALVVLKNSGRDLGGGKEREIALKDRLKCHELLEEAVDSGARLFKAREVMGITVRTYQRWGRIAHGRARATTRGEHWPTPSTRRRRSGSWGSRLRKPAVSWPRPRSCRSWLRAVCMWPRNPAFTVCCATRSSSSIEKEAVLGRTVAPWSARPPGPTSPGSGTSHSCARRFEISITDCIWWWTCGAARSWRGRWRGRSRATSRRR
jgi:hypothetical protein